MPVIPFPHKELNKKRVTLVVVISSLLVVLFLVGIIYFWNASFRGWIDIYFFRKETHSENLPTIEINADEDQYFYAYDKYLAVLNKNILYTYTSSGQLANQNDLSISSPIFASNHKFLVAAENNGNSVYLISGTNILWQNTVDGSIYKVTVNKNGYVSVIVTGTNYKSIVISFDTKGKELFKTYLSSNIAIDAAISNDNKYLSIAEINYSGSVIKSIVKNISIEKAKTDPTNSVIYHYALKDNILLTSIAYQDKNILVCMGNDGIYCLHLSDFSNEQIVSSDNYEFMDIHLKNHILYTSIQSQGFSSNSIVFIADVQKKDNTQYTLKGSIKSIDAMGEKIAINTGSQIHFIGLNGWLIKKIDSSNEINHIILGDSVAGIVYKNKIEIVEI